MANDYLNLLVDPKLSQESLQRQRTRYTDMINKCHQNMANIYLNGYQNFEKAEQQIDMIMSHEPSKEFPSCKTYYLRA